MGKSYVIWNDTVALGDTLCTFPGTLAFARMAAGQLAVTSESLADVGEVGIFWTNDAVGDLFPHRKYGFERLSLSNAARELVDARISMHDMVHRGAAYPSLNEHPTAQFMAHVGFPELSDGVLAPEIDYRAYPNLEPYDVLISPYVLAEIFRMWALPKWQRVIDYLRKERGFRRIGVLASSSIPPVEDLAKITPGSQSQFYTYKRHMTHTLEGVDYVVDRPLGEVAYLMSKARLVVTVDSGPARLMHAVMASLPAHAPRPKHVLIAASITGVGWCSYPGVRLVHAELGRLQPEPVLDAIDSELGIPFSKPRLARMDREVMRIGPTMRMDLRG